MTQLRTYSINQQILISGGLKIEGQTRIFKIMEYDFTPNTFSLQGTHTISTTAFNKRSGVNSYEMEIAPMFGVSAYQHALSD